MHASIIENAEIGLIWLKGKKTIYVCSTGIIIKQLDWMYVLEGEKYKSYICLI